MPISPAALINAANSGSRGSGSVTTSSRRDRGSGRAPALVVLHALEEGSTLS